MSMRSPFQAEPVHAGRQFSEQDSAVCSHQIMYVFKHQRIDVITVCVCARVCMCARIDGACSEDVFIHITSPSAIFFLRTARRCSS
jgi:hypothetical protein